MNVLWIEDFGHLQPDSPTLINFFKGLIPSKAFNRHWSPETDLLESPGEIGRFFERHSELHGLTLLRHYGDFLALGETGSNLVLDHDVVAIDINLSQGVSPHIPLPEGHTDSETFHKKAGFYIYNQLIRLGFPDEHICFLTGEKESTFREFADHCHNALMPLPKAFGKDDPGMVDFRAWLEARRQSEYATLRRGVIEGCKLLRKRIAEDPAIIQFGKFFESGTVDVGSMDDYLTTLAGFLPARCPAADQLHGKLRLFSRAVAHEWESKVKPSEGGDRLLRSLGWVMKEARNCLAHSEALNRLAPQDAAYLFMVGMRAMFSLPTKPERFEAVLLSLFAEECRVKFPEQHQIEAALRGSHDRLLDSFLGGGGEISSRNFRELANKAEERRVAGIDYVVLLYQILWHQLAQKGKADNAAGYQCDARLQTFGEEGSFLNVLLKSIYARSF